MSTTVSGVDLIAAANSFNQMARDEVGGVDPADIGVDPTRPGDLFLSAEQLKQLERERKKVGIVGELWGHCKLDFLCRAFFSIF